MCRRAVTAVSRIKGNEEVCQDLFYSLEWTYPITLLEEWNSNGYFDEIEGWYDD
ncbi:putative thrombopoietin receptor [Bacteroides fragilis str. 1007-1-F |uniref:Thrombopoietin receptor n=2 Tax=Bacteroides fragilis TaxID=817 RepID=A0AAN4MV36_BACFG|nr:putative thrombopoietin receptor [Bacteroides fragilis str. 3783N1-2]EXY49064.1 putative thrombopoietin receptor [Bacteroides fragilis str. 3783N2-1]EXZ70662.1 putative thrombopoietin receptor [Bacteroides fragilis str. 3783N1-8]EYA11964.1 putative thrombopoietin receptor [Bacteroides fragilis str. 1007-1-F \